MAEVPEGAVMEAGCPAVAAVGCVSVCNWRFGATTIACVPGSGRQIQTATMIAAMIAAMTILRITLRDTALHFP